MTDNVNDGVVENIQRIAFVSTAGVAFGMKQTLDGKIRTNDTPYGYDVAEGNISNHQAFYRTGYTALVSNTSGDLWSLGATVPNIELPPSSGRGFTVLTASTLDSTAGVGIRTVIVDYLDTSFTTQTTTLSLSTAALGSTATATNMMRINSIRADTAGASGKANGIISVAGTSAGSTQIYRQIAVGETRARAGAYTVPDGRTLYITDIIGGVGSGSAGSYVRIKLVANQNEDGSTETFYLPFWENIMQFNGIQHLDIPIKFSQHTDVKFVAVTNQSSGMPVQAAMRGWSES